VTNQIEIFSLLTSEMIKPKKKKRKRRKKKCYTGIDIHHITPVQFQTLRQIN